MKKWILAILLTSLLASLLIGCSDKSDDSGVQKDQNIKPPAETQSVDNGTDADTNAGANTNTNSNANTTVETNTPGQQPEGEQHFADIDKLSTLFGFTNSDGSQIIVTGQNAGLEASMPDYGKMIGEGGKTYSVKFVKWQKGSEQSNGRDTANNFANLEGYIFDVINGKAAGNETYYVVNEQDFDLKSLIKISSPEQTMTDEELETEETLKDNISLMKDRGVTDMWSLADIGSDQKLYLVKFENKDKNRLFSIVLFTGDDFLFQDYPAIAEDDFSVWRVDDGGEVSPDMFPLLFAAETRQGLLLGLSWWGSEGLNTFFLAENEGNLEELEISYGRYTAP